MSRQLLVAPGASRRPGRGRRLPFRRAATVDVVGTIAFALVLTWASVSEAYPKAKDLTGGVSLPHPPLWAYGLVTLASLALLLRRRWPLQVVAASTAAVLAYTCLGYVDGASLLAPAVATYGVAVAVSARRAVISTAIALAALMAANAAFDPLGAFAGGFVLLPGLFVVPLFLGFAVKNRRAYLAAVEDRASAAERSRDDEARRQVDAERLRIARELHDVVAHTMSLINVQAGVAAHVAAEQPELAVATLTAIKLASREGLRELRAILNVLREADEGEPTNPAPRLDQVSGLFIAAEAAGMRVTVTTTGIAGPLPPTVDLTAYRIVQESLTNALRHAPGTHTMVSLCYEPHMLRIDVVGTGIPAATTAPAEAGGGHGIMGMRERAAAVGGTLSAGRCPDGGFAVRAALPLATDA